MTVTLTSPEVPTPLTTPLALIKGNDYTTGDSHTVSFSVSDWPSLAGATVTLYARDVRTRNPLFKSVGTADSGVTPQTVTFELTRDQTNNLQSSQQVFEAVATFSDLSERTIASGDISLCTSTGTLVSP